MFFFTAFALPVAAAFVALDFFAAGFVVVDFGVADFESTVLGSFTVFSRLASLVVFLSADFTVLGAIFWLFGLLVPDTLFG